MKVLILGIGLQGKTALYDLVNSDGVEEIIAADFEIDALEKLVETNQYDRVQCEFLDARKQESIDKLMALNPNVVIDLLPVGFINKVVESAVKHGVHFVNTNSRTSKMIELAEEAKKKGITLLPEFGLDPGIDLVLLGEAYRGMVDVEEIMMYGAGIPEIEAADNVLKYKETWTFEGVVRSYFRPAKLIRNGLIIPIKENEVFNPDNRHEIDVKGIGNLEVFPNGDALRFLDVLGITDLNSAKFKNIKSMGRYTMRYLGHCKFWKKLIDLHLLDDEPIILNEVAIDRKEYLAQVIKPHIQLKSNERDIAIVRVELVGYKAGEKIRAIYQVLDKRDLETGFTGMNRTVGYTVSIGAQLIGKNKVSKRGLLSPVDDIPFELLEEELKKRGIEISFEYQSISD